MSDSFSQFLPPKPYIYYCVVAMGGLQVSPSQSPWPPSGQTLERFQDFLRCSGQSYSARVKAFEHLGIVFCVDMTNDRHLHTHISMHAHALTQTYEVKPRIKPDSAF